MERNCGKLQGLSGEHINSIHTKSGPSARNCWHFVFACDSKGTYVHEVTSCSSAIVTWARGPINRNIRLQC